MATAGKTKLEKHETEGERYVVRSTGISRKIQETEGPSGSHDPPFRPVRSEDQEIHQPQADAGAAIQNALRLVLIGMTGTGKSSVGNSIVAWGLYLLHRARIWETKLWDLDFISKPFPSKPSPNSVTTVCKKETHTILGRKVSIVDTPGFLDTREKPPYRTTLTEVTKCICDITPGPHAIILVVKVDRFTEEVVKAIDLVKTIFSKDCVKYLIVVFTYTEKLDKDYTLDNFVQDLSGTPFQLLRECHMRYIGFSNQFDPLSGDNKAQVEKLLKMIEELVEKNQGGCYQEEFLRRATEAMDQEGDATRAAESEQGRAIRKDMWTKIRDFFSWPSYQQSARSPRRPPSQPSPPQSGGCFSSDSVVQVRDLKGNVGVKYLKDLVVGDLVQSYDPEIKSFTYSPVYYIIYQDDNGRLSSLRELVYEGGDGKEHSIRLQGKHLIYASCGPLLALKTEEPPSTPIMSEKVNVGDTLWVADDDTDDIYPRRVLKINEIEANVRHPMTMNHTIVVDGVLASVHTHSEWVLRQATAPLRLLYKISPRLSDFWISKKAVQAWDYVEYYILNNVY